MKYTVEIASVPDREDAVAEIWLGDEMIAELARESSSKVVLEIYPNPNGCPWKLDFAEFLAAMEDAKKELLK